MIQLVLAITGPTASGKSALALALARDLRGTIINADALQVYRELRLLTARPTPDEEASVPHALYGVRAAANPSSAAWWRTAALAEITKAHAAGRLPILTGGSGLYFAALTQGLADIPEPAPEVRAQARKLLKEIGPAALHARLAAVDPATAGRLRQTDSQRIARAWEVWIGSGTGLAAWQAKTGPPAAFTLAAIVLDPPRSDLRAAISARFATMVASGALDEVQALLGLGLDPALPVMRAHGVRELSAHLRGELTLADATRRVELATGRYSKRQLTWLRHHPLTTTKRTFMISAQLAPKEKFLERNYPKILAFIESMG
jgi:tRNA dimethylallyltransferase